MTRPITVGSLNDISENSRWLVFYANLIYSKTSRTIFDDIFEKLGIPQGGYQNVLVIQANLANNGIFG